MKGEARVVFRQYGDRIFLAQVWIPGTGSARELHKTETEKSVEREAAKGMTAASDRAEAATVTILGK